MEIDFGQPIINAFTGTPQRMNVGEGDERYLTLGLACANVLYSRLDGDSKIAPITALEYKRLAERVINGGVIEITHKEAVLMQERLAQGYPVAICGQAIEMLEGNKSKGEDE